MLQRYVMGTFLSVRVRADDASESRPAYELFFNEIQRLERLLSLYQPESDISRINQAAGLTPVHVSADTYRAVNEALHYAEESFGAFDPTLGHYKQVRLNADNQTIFLSRAGVRLDLGGIGKGFALDRAIERVSALSTVQSVRADFGGQLLFWDHAGQFSPERVAIENPENRNDLLMTFEVDRNGSVSTSSNAERAGHLTDPRTGQPAQGMASVTVIAPTGTEAEALSTALFVLNPDEAVTMLEKYPGVHVYAFPAARTEEVSLMV